MKFSMPLVLYLIRYGKGTIGLKRRTIDSADRKKFLDLWEWREHGKRNRRKDQGTSGKKKNEQGTAGR